MHIRFNVVEQSPTFQGFGVKLFVMPSIIERKPFIFRDTNPYFNRHARGPDV